MKTSHTHARLYMVLSVNDRNNLEEMVVFCCSPYEGHLLGGHRNDITSDHSRLPTWRGESF
jgi:hypothetical protein